MAQTFKLRHSAIAQLTSMDQSRDYSFDVPIKDPLAGMNRVSGNYPWRLDNGYSTVLHLKNTIDQEVYALVQVRYEGGTYNPERIKLAPYQTVAVNLRELRDNQQKDVRDEVMPKEVASGQVLWYEEEPGSLIGRAETFSLRAGVASSFSCGGVCPNCPPWYNSSYMSPASYFGVTAETGQPFRPMQTKRDCYGTILGPYDMTLGSTWASLNTSIATVTFGGQVTCLNPGATSIRATFSVIPVACGFPSSATASPTGGLTVCDTNLAGPTPVTRGSSATYSICAQATGVSWQFSGGGGTASQSGGTSWSGTMVTSGTVTVSFTFKGQSYTRTKSVTVNNRSGFAFSAVSAVERSNGYNCGNGVILNLPSPPSSGGDAVGKFCLRQEWSFNSSEVPSGPNQGFKYVTSITNNKPDGTVNTCYHYVISPDLKNTSSQFYTKQYGNYNPQTNTGFISGANLLANTIRHESGTVQSHYKNYTDAQNNASNNMGTVAESYTRPPSVPLNTFIGDLNSLLTAKKNTIENSHTS